MGYYSRYELYSQDQSFDVKKSVLSLNENMYPDLIDIFENGDELNFTTNIKDEVTAFSKLHPNIVFELYVSGSSGDERSICYFKDGKSYEVEAEITYPKFDESKLNH